MQQVSSKRCVLICQKACQKSAKFKAACTMQLPASPCPLYGRAVRVGKGKAQEGGSEEAKSMQGERKFWNEQMSFRRRGGGFLDDEAFEK